MGLGSLSVSSSLPGSGCAPSGASVRANNSVPASVRTVMDILTRRTPRVPVATSAGVEYRRPALPAAPANPTPTGSASHAPLFPFSLPSFPRNSPPFPSALPGSGPATGVPAELLSHSRRTTTGRYSTCGPARSPPSSFELVGHDGQAVRLTVPTSARPLRHGAIGSRTASHPTYQGWTTGENSRSRARHRRTPPRIPRPDAERGQHRREQAPQRSRERGLSPIAARTRLKTAPLNLQRRRT